MFNRGLVSSWIIWGVLGLIVIGMVSGCSTKNSKGKEDGWEPARGIKQDGSSEAIMVRVEREDSDVIEISYRLPDARCVSAGVGVSSSGQEIEYVVIGNAEREDSEVGKPALPVVPCTLILPAGRTVESVVVSGGRKVELAGSHFIRPVQQQYPISMDVPLEETHPDKSVYGSDEIYPTSLYKVESIQRWRGVSYLILVLYPVEYRPLSGRVAYYKSLSVKVRTRQETAAERSNIYYRPDPIRRMDDGVENPRTLKSYEVSKEVMKPATICSPDETYKYVVITSRDIINAATVPNLQDFLESKRAKGLTATAVAIEDIYAQYTGVDNAEKVRNFIIDAYRNWKTDFVLLGGDTNIVPLRCVWVEFMYTQNVPTDLYYACLDGPYNRNGNARWGEPNDGLNGGDVDIFADVYVGRASAENAEEFSNFVYKTLAYERSHSSESYLHTALMLGEYMGFTGDSEYAKPAMEEIRKGVSQTKGFLSYSGGKVDTLYEEEGVTWYKSDLLAKINSNTYSIINHMGHGQPDQAMKIRNTDDNLFTNTKFLFVNSQACHPGAFDEDCLAEHLTTSHRHGFFAAVMNSRFGIIGRDDTNGASQLFQRWFWHAYFGKGITQLGPMLADMRYERRWNLRDSNRLVYFEITLFGDPELKLRYTEPATPPSPPTADFSAAPVTGTAPLTVQFTDKSTGSINEWKWDFNDDGVIDSTVQNPKYTYTKAGTYSVTLTVSGPNGSSTAIKTGYITVTAPVNEPPSASFSAAPVSGEVPLTVKFTDKSTGTIDSWYWDFGDGTSSTEQNPTHIYTSPGKYTVTLTVSNAAGSNTDTKADYINVTPKSAVELLAANFTGPILKSGWKRNCGWRFVCKSDIAITKVMFYGNYASKVTIWDDNGNLLASVAVTGSDKWGEAELSSPLALSAGRAYRLAVYTPTDFWYVEAGKYTSSADITITNGCYGAWESEGFPSILQTWAVFGLVNFKYTK